ncbi:DUF3566 domain-containing protein [Actinomycetospora sp. C-140]
MSTPSKPEEPSSATSEETKRSGARPVDVRETKGGGARPEQSETSGPGGTRTSTQEPADAAASTEATEGTDSASATTAVPAVEGGGDTGRTAETSAPGGSSGATNGSANGHGDGEAGSGSGPVGPPPPWQRGGTAVGPPSGPLPAGGRPAGPPTPAGGQPRPGPGGPPGGPGGPGGAHPPSGPFPRPGGPGPQGGPNVGPPSGGIPVAARTAPSGGAARPGGTGEAGPGSGASGIDAPTNQLSPEQLGLRQREADDRREPDDVAELAAARPRSGKAPRRASLQVRRFDPWSVLKLALVLGVALFFVWMFAVGVLYAVLDGMGVWAQLNGTYQDLTSDAGGGGELITAGGVFGVAAVIGVVNIILFTALASVSAFIYNISADVAGGIEVTLSERE